MDETLITQAGLAKLHEELAQLRTIGRAEILERIRRAADAEANAVESADYQDARSEQAIMERRIALLEDRIATATVVEPDATNGVLDVGERVILRNLDDGTTVEYELVGAHESDPSAGRISAVSPLGRALLGRRRGDVAVVEAPRGRLSFEVVAIGPVERSATAVRLAS